MKRRELEALRAKRDELNVFAAWRAVAECLSTARLKTPSFEGGAGWR